jgi:hypothetical protein
MSTLAAAPRARPRCVERWNTVAPDLIQRRTVSPAPIVATIRQAAGPWHRSSLLDFIPLCCMCHFGQEWHSGNGYHFFVATHSQLQYIPYHLL